MRRPTAGIARDGRARRRQKDERCGRPWLLLPGARAGSSCTGEGARPGRLSMNVIHPGRPGGPDPSRTPNRNVYQSSGHLFIARSRTSGSDQWFGAVKSNTPTLARTRPATGPRRAAGRGGGADGGGSSAQNSQLWLPGDPSTVGGSPCRNAAVNSSLGSWSQLPLQHGDLVGRATISTVLSWSHIASDRSSASALMTPDGPVRAAHVTSCAGTDARSRCGHAARS